VRFALQSAGYVFGLLFEFLIVTALLRGGGYKRFPFVFIYTVADFVTTVLEIPTAIAYVRGVRTATVPYAALYWVDEIIIQVLIYAVVISLIYEATRHLRSRRVLRASVISGAVLIAGITFLIHYSPVLNQGSWMTPWTRDLNFCSAILDLGLWALLVGSRSLDHRMLMLSGGLGIKFAGESIGESVRQLAIRSRSRSISLTGNILILLANISFLYIWWRAVRTSEAEPPTREAAPKKY
jgi:hypothetical protein